MGRIKTALVKRKTKEIFSKKKEIFTSNFEENKKRLAEIADIPSKKIKNTIAGYITRLIKQQRS